MTAYGTSIGYPPLRKLIAERHQVDPSRVLVTNGSMQADAFLFDALIEPGDSVIVERPTYDRTLLSLRNRGADVRAVELEPTASMSPPSNGSSPPGRARSSPTSSPPSRTRPGTRCRPTSASGWSNWLEPTSSWCSRTTLTSRSGSRARRWRRCFRPTARGSPTRRLSRRPSVPGSGSGYLVGPEELIARIVKIATSTYISPSMVSQGIVYEFSRRARSNGRSRPSSRRSPAGQDARRDTAQRASRRRFRAGGRLLHVGGSPRAPTSARSSSCGASAGCSS